MKTQNSKLSMIALAALVIASCGKNGNKNDQYGYASGGRCRTQAVGGQIVYSETGVGYALRNGVLAELTLTILVDVNGRMSASGEFNVPNAETFFNEGTGGGYVRSPIRGALRTCVTSQAGAGSWDDQNNMTASQLTLIGGNVQVVLDAGTFVSSNGLFAEYATVGVRGQPTSGTVTFDPNAY